MGFSVTGCFRGRPRLRFVVGSTGSMDSWETSGVGKGVSSSSGSTSRAVSEVSDRK
jgi:hypothetical protein